jgi:alanyl-tRNA synthetase
MKPEEIRKKFLDFFKEKGHKIIPSSPLIPADSTVLFTIAGMQQFNLALAGEEDPLEKFGSQILASCQKCFRTIDIEEVGDDTHHTFFEMLGNWSIGEGYFKEKAIEYALEFFGDVLKLEKNRIWVTIFKGEKGISKDEDSIQIWQENGNTK